MSSAQQRLYLDHAATTPVDPRVREAMLPYLDDRAFGNPSSLHIWGREARKALEKARQTMASCLGAQPEEFIFTGGATEADNLAITGLAMALESRGRHLITTAIEHPAIDAPCRTLMARGWDVTFLPVDGEGFISLADLRAALRPDTVLVSVIHGNNEVGTIQPIEAIGALIRDWNATHRPEGMGVLFHTDAVQTVGKLPLDLSHLPVDYLSLSAHKIYGPKGVGALYIREGAPRPMPLIVGGGQEGDLRPGTENLAGIVGLARALEIATGPEAGEGGPTGELSRLRALQNWFITEVPNRIHGAILNGPRDVTRRVPGNVHFSFPPGEGEALVLKLDIKGIAVSSGSACHSAVIEPSRIVQALGKTDDIARATLRFSMGRTTTQADLERLLDALVSVTERLKAKSLR